MVRPELMEAMKYKEEYGALPLSVEINGDIRTPMEVLRTLKARVSHCFILESLENANQQGRYTFLGFDPAMGISCTDGRIAIRERGGETTETGKPQEVIRRILAENKSPEFPFLPPFTGGFVGYFAYEYIKYSEPALLLNAENEEGFRDVDLMLFHKVIAFDHLTQKMILMVNIRTEDLEANYETGVRELAEMEALIREDGPRASFPAKVTSEFRSLFDKERYCEMVEKGKGHIKEGDIFQVVLSNRLEADFEGSLLNTYRILRMENPSPYMFYFSGDEVEIAGASPETLVKYKDGEVRTFPLAGTRRRGATQEEDLALERDLLADEKELAEHNMLVDLGRNDIGRISSFGTVAVEDYLNIHRFSRVMHIGSVVKGRLREGLDALDAVDAILPAGTLSGAPKIRACQIIRDLEKNKRGIYGGAIGYISLTGNLDTCIGIRIAYKLKDKVYVRAGAGIVADSVPEKEYRECLDKAGAVMDAVLRTGEVND